MTTTKSEQILAYLATELGDLGGVSGRVYRSRTEAFSRNESPSVIIEPSTDTASSQPVSTCYIDWTFQVLIAIYSKGEHGLGQDSPDQIADPVIHAIHDLVMTDRTLGGLAMDVWPLSRDPQIVSAEDPSMVTVLTYQVRYRTSLLDLGA
jgi:hypothetical protein